MGVQRPNAQKLFQPFAGLSWDLALLEFTTHTLQAHLVKFVDRHGPIRELFLRDTTCLGKPHEHTSVVQDDSVSRDAEGTQGFVKHLDEREFT